MSKTEVFVMADKNVPKGMCKYQLPDGSWHFVPIKVAVHIIELENYGARGKDTETANYIADCVRRIQELDELQARHEAEKPRE